MQYLDVRNCNARIYNGILSLGELGRKYIYAFMKRISEIENCVIAAFMSYSNILSDRLWTHWHTTDFLSFNSVQRYCTIFIFSIIINFLGYKLLSLM